MNEEMNKEIGLLCCLGEVILFHGKEWTKFKYTSVSNEIEFVLSMILYCLLEMVKEGSHYKYTDIN